MHYLLCYFKQFQQKIKRETLFNHELKYLVFLNVDSSNFIYLILIANQPIWGYSMPRG